MQVKATSCWRYSEDPQNPGLCLRCGQGQFWHKLKGAPTFKAADLIKAYEQHVAVDIDVPTLIVAALCFRCKTKAYIEIYANGFCIPCPDCGWPVK